MWTQKAKERMGQTESSTEICAENKDHGIWSHHFMANRWETMEIVKDIILGGSKITADGDCRHEIKRCLLLGRKVMTKLDSILKSRDIIRDLCQQRSI